MHLPHWIVVDSGMLATAGVGRPSSPGEPSHLQREVQARLWSPGLWSDSGAGPAGHIVPRGTSLPCGSPRTLFLPLVLIPYERWVSSNTVSREGPGLQTRAWGLLGPSALPAAAHDSARPFTPAQEATLILPNYGLRSHLCF